MPRIAGDQHRISFQRKRRNPQVSIRQTLALPLKPCFDLTEMRTDRTTPSQQRKRFQ